MRLGPTSCKGFTKPRRSPLQQCEYHSPAYNKSRLSVPHLFRHGWSLVHLEFRSSKTCLYTFVYVRLLLYQYLHIVEMATDACRLGSMGKEILIRSTLPHGTHSLMIATDLAVNATIQDFWERSAQSLSIQRSKTPSSTCRITRTAEKDSGVGSWRRPCHHTAYFVCILSHLSYDA